MKKKIAYLCDKKRHCNTTQYCTLHCKHTFDEFHAKYGNGTFNNRKKKFKKTNTEDGIMFIEEE